MKQVRQLLQRVNASPKLSNEILENIQPTKEGKTDLGYFYHPQFSLIAVSRIRNSHDILNDLKKALCRLVWVIKFELTRDKVNHVDEIVDIPVSSCPFFGQLNFAVDTFEDAV